MSFFRRNKSTKIITIMYEFATVICDFCDEIVYDEKCFHKHREPKPKIVSIFPQFKIHYLEIIDLKDFKKRIIYE